MDEQSRYYKNDDRQSAWNDGFEQATRKNLTYGASDFALVLSAWARLDVGDAFLDGWKNGVEALETSDEDLMDSIATNMVVCSMKLTNADLTDENFMCLIGAIEFGIEAAKTLRGLN